MIDIHRLAVVLRHANTQPPFEAREEFYSLKQAILERYGERDGQDVQHIRKPCWSCTEGCYRHWDGDLETCMKCGGTGIYSERWIVLERWKIAGLVFHRPSHTLAGSLMPPTIEGRTVHRPSKLAFACWRVLALLMQPQFYLYFDQFRMDEKQLRRFKAVLAYLMGFRRDLWRFSAVPLTAFQAGRIDARKVMKQCEGVEVQG